MSNNRKEVKEFVETVESIEQMLRYVRNLSAGHFGRQTTALIGAQDLRQVRRLRQLAAQLLLEAETAALPVVEIERGTPGDINKGWTYRMGFVSTHDYSEYPTHDGAVDRAASAFGLKAMNYRISYPDRATTVAGRYITPDSDLHPARPFVAWAEGKEWNPVLARILERKGREGQQNDDPPKGGGQSGPPPQPPAAPIPPAYKV